MQSPTMLYRCPGIHAIHGGKFDYTIVAEADVESALADGWFLTTTEAKEAFEAAKAPAAPADDNAAPTRAELEAKATELGLTFAKNISDAKLLDRITAALAAQPAAPAAQPAAE